MIVTQMEGGVLEMPVTLDDEVRVVEGGCRVWWPEGRCHWNCESEQVLRYLQALGFERIQERGAC